MPVCPRLAKEWHLVVAEAVAAVAAEVVAVAAEAAVGAVVYVSPGLAGEVRAVPAPAGAVLAALAGAEASSLEALSDALPVEAAEAVEAALHPAGFGRQLGAGSTAAGVALHRRVSHRASRRSKSRRRWRPRKRLTEIRTARERNSGSAARSVN
jgi:hypothetical protein